MGKDVIVPRNAVGPYRRDRMESMSRILLMEDRSQLRPCMKSRENRPFSI